VVTKEVHVGEVLEKGANIHKKKKNDQGRGRGRSALDHERRKEESLAG